VDARGLESGNRIAMKRRVTNGGCVALLLAFSLGAQACPEVVEQRLMRVNQTRTSLMVSKFA